MEVVLPRSVSADCGLVPSLGLRFIVRSSPHCRRKSSACHAVAPSLYRLQPVLGLAQVGFHTVSARRNGRRHRLTKSVFTPTYARFRELLIEARENSKLTQAALAERLNRPQSYVSKFGRGERRLDVIEFLEVAQALRIDAFDLLGRLISRSPKRGRS